MKLLARAFLASLLACVLSGTCLATSDATCLIYQPISMASEGTVIKLPKGKFLILAVPYLSGFSISEKPYAAIALPYSMSSIRGNQNTGDSNLVSRAGVKIRSHCIFEEKKLKQEVVTVDLSQFSLEHVFIDGIVEATLECIRRTATDERQQWLRPTIRIIGSPIDKKKWKSWEDAFNKQDFSKPFKRPNLPKK